MYMKKITLTIALLVFGAAAFAQWQVSYGMNFNVGHPTRGMSQFISRGHGITIYMEARKEGMRVSPIFEISYLNYGRDKSRQTYEFSDGTTADMDIVVGNDVMTAMGGAKIYLRSQGFLQPYVVVKAGRTSYMTNLSIFDPDDGDHCEPVDSDVLSRDATWVYGAGGGLQIDMASVLSRRLEPGIMYLDLGINSQQGGRVNYMNVDAPVTASQHSMGTRSQDVQADFLNTQTQVVHQHHVGYLYNSFVQMVDFRIGFTIRIDKSLRSNADAMRQE